MHPTRSGDREAVRLLTWGIATLCGLTIGAAQCKAADGWGGSMALSSDYFVRGISRTNHQVALQLDLHYSSSSGFAAGAFASNARIDPNQPRDAELSGFIAYAWNVASDWRGEILASYYSYPLNQAGTHYNYEDIDLDLAYQGWLHFSLEYSPNAPRFLGYPYDGVKGVSESSAEVSVQRPVLGKLSAIAGVGYSFLYGPDSGGYAYWSMGGAYDLRSLTVVFSYIDTSARAKSLFYSGASTGRWTGTVIWRF